MAFFERGLGGLVKCERRRSPTATSAIRATAVKMAQRASGVKTPEVGEVCGTAEGVP